MFLCAPCTTHIKSKGGPYHSLLLAVEEGRSCSTHAKFGKLEGVHQACHGQKKETRRARERNV